jgi:Ca2+/H+ antiporter, TMEM165/GDT1 family
MQRKMRARMMFMIIPLALAGLALMGWLVMALWNAVLVPVLHVGVLGYWQALGLFLLSKLLFGGFRGGGGWGRRRAWREKMEQKWAGMSPEDRERFQQEWRNRCAGWKRPSTTENPAAE